MTKLQNLTITYRELHELTTIWTKDDVPIEESGIRYNFLDSWNRTLELIQANRTYNGIYGCRVELKTGGYLPITATAKVFVHGEDLVFFLIYFAVI